MYIVSKGRWESRLTSKACDKINVPYYMVINENEYDQYAKVMDEKKLLIMPQKYYDEYDTFDNLGNTKAKGPGAARNFCWDHSVGLGAKRHWVFDDNIGDWYWFNRNKRIRVADGAMFSLMENWVERFTNVAIAGPNYRFFVVPTQIYPHFITNTRIYSMLLIRNDLPFRWRGRYNEDTDLSLRVLKSGLCTVQFNAFLGDKAWTQTVKGGNSAQFYDKDVIGAWDGGTYPKSKMQVDMHPDVSKIVYRFQRCHHLVDYSSFVKKNKLEYVNGIEIPQGINNHGVILKKVND
jgi:hypothetical protein